MRLTFRILCFKITLTRRDIEKALFQALPKGVDRETVTLLLDALEALYQKED